MEGFIKLFRKLLDNPIWKSKEPFCRRAAWVDLLLLANHDDHVVWEEGESFKVCRGEVNRSQQYLADRWHWSRGKVNRFMHELEVNGMCTLKRTGKRTAILVENYSTWQDTRTGKRTLDGQVTDSSRTGGGQVADTYKNDKEGKERLRRVKNIVPEVPEEAHVYVDGEVYHYRNGVLQYSPDETRELLRTSHEGWLETKRRLGML